MVCCTKKHQYIICAMDTDVKSNCTHEHDESIEAYFPGASKTNESYKETVTDSAEISSARGPV